MSIRTKLLRAIMLTVRGFGLVMALLGAYLIWYALSLPNVEAAFFIFLGGITGLVGVDIIRNPHHAFDYFMSDDDDEDDQLGR